MPNNEQNLKTFESPYALGKHPYYRVPFTIDPRGTIAKKVFPFGETNEEIARFGGEDFTQIENGTRGNPLFHRWYEEMKRAPPGVYSEELLQKGDAAPLGVV